MGRLLRRVGLAEGNSGGARAAMADLDGGLEALEERRLLFTLTVAADDVNPATGLGTAVAEFGYALPYLWLELPDTVDAEIVDEDFEDEMANWTMLVPAAPPSGTFFEQSNIRITYSSTAAFPVLWVVGADPDDMEDRDLDVTLRAQDSLTFTFFQGDDEDERIPHVATSAVLVLRGLDLSAATGTRVELLNEGQVVATYTGNQLAARSAAHIEGTQFTFDFAAGFEAIRFSSAAPTPDNNNYLDNFFVEQIGATFPGGRFGDWVNERLVGVRVTLTGPVGTSANFLDFYGREMRETLAVGVPPDSMVALIDRNDDGVPDFNDGIGRVTLSNTTAESSITLIGGTVEFDDMLGWIYVRPDLDGRYDDFESGGGYGFGLDRGTDPTMPTIIGLPPGFGSMVIGNPWVRDNSSAVAYTEIAFPGDLNRAYLREQSLVDNPDQFNRADQGVFVTGQQMGSFVMHGMLFGSSNIAGSIRSFNVSNLYGSLAIAGDAGYIGVAGEAGTWRREDADPMLPALNTTNSQIVVGRTAGEIAIGGRSAVDISVQADINNPALPVLDRFEYAEREVVYQIDTGADEIVLFDALENNSDNPAFIASFFGSRFFRNDTILSAEWVGSNSSAVHITGQLGFENPVDSPDPSDVYAFAVDGTREIVVAEDGFGVGMYYRVVDADGRVVAANRVGSNAVGLANGALLRFRPDRAGVFYLVVNADPNTTTSYGVTISGIAPTTFGSYRSGASTGMGIDPPSIEVRSGSMGLFRVGTAYVGGDGGEVDPGETTNGPAGDDNADFLNAFATIGGTLYSFITGSDVDGAQLVVSGNLGELYTGMSPVFGVGATEGDLTNFTLRVGGSIGLFDVRGGIGINQDGDPDGRNQAVSVRTGANGGIGDIGAVLVGAYISGPSVSFRTSPGSIIGMFIVGNNNGGAGTDFPGQLVDFRPQIIMGTGSDLRFADFSVVETAGDRDARTELTEGQSVTFTDDAGATVRITVSGGDGTSTATIRVLPIDGSQGVAIARIDATLNGGARLQITGETPGVVSIGRVNITTDDTGGSRLIFNGVAEIDVWRIDHVAGAPLDLLQNQTVGGDIVAADLTGLNRAIVLGDIGRTQTARYGPTAYGPFLGIADGFVTAVGGALGVEGGSLASGRDDGQWNGEIFLPINAGEDFYMDGSGTLEDLGSPFDAWLNGIVVRNGDVQEIRVNGAMGDLILQGGDLHRLVVNDDGLTAFGGFDGIIGTIYANAIRTIDIGDGMRGTGPGPFALSGIFADDDIFEVVSRRINGATITGAIVAANVNQAVRTTIGTVGIPTPLNAEVSGFRRIEMTNGLIDSAFIGSIALDAWWTAARPTVQDDVFATGNMREMALINTNLFRSEVHSQIVETVTLTGGFFDGTFLNATNRIGSITAAGFRNTTLFGNSLEVRQNLILATRNIGTISAIGVGAEIQDLSIDAGGSLTGSVSATNIVRLLLDVDGSTQLVSALNDIRATSIISGRLVSAIATGDIRSSSFMIAGPIENVSAGGSITTTQIHSTGPNGRIGTILAGLFVTGDIQSSGAITTIQATAFDVIATIVTTDTDGSLGLLTAGRDVIVDMRIDGSATRIAAGRNVGRLNEADGVRALNIRGNLGSIETPNGQIYTDVQVGESITGLITIGRVIAKPGNDQVSTADIHAYGRIAAVTINGDFNGDIVSQSGGIGIITILNGSFRPGNQIRANDGSIDQVTIIGGHLMGDVIAEGNITLIQVLASPTFFGDIGINPNLSATRVADAFRNQLPPGVSQDATLQGPRIQAGGNIGIITVDRGSMWETGIIAGFAIGSVNVFGVIRNDNLTPGWNGNFIIAGDSIGLVTTGGFVGGTVIAAGITDLGADDMPGGTGADADTVKPGRVGQVTLGRGAAVVAIAAGMTAGEDGRYGISPATGTSDDRVAPGSSFIDGVTITGGKFRVSAFADSFVGPTSPGILRGGRGQGADVPGRVVAFVPTTGLLAKGVPQSFTNSAGEFVTVLFTGPGRIYWTPATDTLSVINSTLASTLTVSSSTENLTDFTIRSNDGASMGVLNVQANLQGVSTVYFDNVVGTARFGAVTITSIDVNTGVIGVGGDATAMIFGPFTRGQIRANFIGSLTFGSDFGLEGEEGEARIDANGLGIVAVGDELAGLINSDRDIASLTVSGPMDRARVRAGRTITLLSGQSATNTRISAGAEITTITFSGSVTSTLIYAGADLGPNAAFDASGNAPLLRNGVIGSVTIGGNFQRSDIAAGVSRGPDGYLGTADDEIDEGRSSIGPVTIGGTLVGSGLGSETFRVISNGALGLVRVGGQVIQTRGNFAISDVDTRELPVRITDLQVTEEARIYTAEIFFNQPVNPSLLSEALTVSELRSGDTVKIRLAEGLDYSIEYDAAQRVLRVVFSRELLERNLPQAPGIPGPGVYRFELDAGVLRGQTVNARLDGNGDGVAGGDADSWSEDAFVGDVGDKIGSARVNTGGGVVDFYPSGNLNLVLDNNYAPDGLADVNREFTIRGSLGDHPDHNVNTFRAAGDVDLYRVTLRAGQILRLGEIEGNALFAGRSLLNAAGEVQFTTQGLFSGTADTAFVRTLPSPAGALDSLTAFDEVLIKQTGTYYIMVTAAPGAPDVTNALQVPNPPLTAGTTGPYRFTVQVFDDGNTGFRSDTDSGNGTNVSEAPLPSDTGFNNPTRTFTLAEYTYTLALGADGVRDTADDVVTGTNSRGITVERLAGADGAFGTADDAVSATVQSAIGLPGQVGVPEEIAPDVDVWHLNSGEAIQPGTRYRVTLRLTETGSNLGLARQVTLDSLRDTTALLGDDLSGTVQLGLFDVSAADSVDDGILVAAPSDLLPVGGTPNTVMATSPRATYGFDDRGDFFMDFVMPPRQDVAGQVPGRFAIVVQGAIRSEYTLEIVRQGTGSTTPRTQNVLLELNGGVIDWLQAGDGVQTTLAGYTTSVVGFTGFIGSQRVDDYVLAGVLSGLNDVFAAANVDIRVSSSPASFEGQAFSTVFLSSSVEPNEFFNDGTFGASQRSDPFNADLRDDGAVFLPSLGVLGFSASQAGVDQFIQALTAAVARRIGELVGLRTLADGATDPMAAGAIAATSNLYRYGANPVDLSDTDDVLIDTDFFIGQQDSVSLLDLMLPNQP